MKYTKNNVTYEADTAEELVALVRAFESPGDDGWVKWDGGECPVDGKVVYKMRDGEEGRPWESRDLRWDHIGYPGDIIAYKVVDPRRVYVVRWVDAEPYEPWSGVHKIFATREGAESYIEEKGLGPHDQDLDDGAFGYYLSSEIQEYEVVP